jgi:hypothetical protein
MPERKFSGIRAEIEKAKQNPPTAAGRTEAPTSAAPTGKGRAPGKRSNPAWRQHTVMLEKETHLAALDILRRQDTGKDISDLLNGLLAHWVKQNQPKT